MQEKSEIATCYSRRVALEASEKLFKHVLRFLMSKYTARSEYLILNYVYISNLTKKKAFATHC